jgi:hypothetical protein
MTEMSGTLTFDEERCNNIEHDEDAAENTGDEERIHQIGAGTSISK